MAGVTTWTARRAKSGDKGRILCGRIVGDRYVCPEMVARLALWAGDGLTDELPADDEIWVPVGLTDDGSPDVCRWSSYSRARARLGERGMYRFSRGGGKTRAIRIAGKGVTIPCPQGHLNHVDATVLSA